MLIWQPRLWAYKSLKEGYELGFIQQPISSVKDRRVGLEVKDGIVGMNTDDMAKHI